MNQRGEVLLTSCLVIFLGSLLFLLAILEVKKSFHNLQKRSKIILCTKEMKGEIKNLLIFTGRANWAIKNINRAEIIMTIFPDLRVGKIGAKGLKKSIKVMQNLKVISFLKFVTLSNQKGCPFNMAMFKTPFKRRGISLKRNINGGLILRKKTWKYHLRLSPYNIKMTIKTRNWESLFPKVDFYFQEKKERLFPYFSF